MSMSDAHNAMNGHAEVHIAVIEYNSFNKFKNLHTTSIAIVYIIIIK